MILSWFPFTAGVEGTYSLCIPASLLWLGFRAEFDCYLQNLSRKVSRKCLDMVSCRLDLVRFQCRKGERRRWTWNSCGGYVRRSRSSLVSDHVIFEKKQDSTLSFSQPLPFKCSITPRDAQAEKLVAATEIEMDWVCKAWVAFLLYVSQYRPWRCLLSLDSPRRNAYLPATTRLPVLIRPDSFRTWSTSSCRLFGWRLALRAGFRRSKGTPWGIRLCQWTLEVLFILIHFMV